MIARVTQYHMDPSKEDEATAKLGELAGRVKALPGVLAAYSTWRSADGEGVTFAVYESQAAVDAAASEIQSIWSELAPFMTAPPTPGTFENVRNMTE